MTAITNLFKGASNTTSVPAGQTIFREGDHGDQMYVLQEGEVDIQIHGRYVQTVKPGTILGEMALIDRSPRSATAVARTDCRVVPLDERQFQYLIQETPFFALHVMRVIVERLRAWPREGW